VQQLVILFVFALLLAAIAVSIVRLRWYPRTAMAVPVGVTVGLLACVFVVQAFGDLVPDSLEGPLGVVAIVATAAISLGVAGSAGTGGPTA
jgi:low affinity Fe/Cu permease